MMIKHVSNDKPVPLASRCTSDVERLERLEKIKFKKSKLSVAEKKKIQAIASAETARIKDGANEKL